MYVVIEWPCCVRDRRIFLNSAIQSWLQDGSIPYCHNDIGDGRDAVPVCLIGDPAYPQLPHIMKENP